MEERKDVIRKDKRFSALIYPVFKQQIREDFTPIFVT